MKKRNKWQVDQPKFEVVRNSTLVCTDCKHRIDDSKKPRNTSRCKKYEVKPDGVLLGQDCPQYEREEDK